MDTMTFKLLHIIGVLVLFIGLGGLGTKKIFRYLHALGSLLILVGGVMMVYHLGLHGEAGVPLWVKLKLVVLIGLGSLIVMSRRPSLIKFVLPTGLILGSVATYLALYQPF